MTTATILLLNGPNLNLLGQREPHIYGTMSLAKIETRLESLAAESRAKLLCFQSNSEGALIDKIQSAAKDGVGFMIVNAAAYSHSSIALRDTLAGVNIPYIEVHLSNVYAREPFRHHSHLSALAKGVICGLGPLGYEFALAYALHYLKEKA